MQELFFDSVNFLAWIARKTCSRTQYRQSAADPRLSPSRDPNRTVQKEKSIYSRRQKNSSKNIPLTAQARSRSSLFRHKRTTRIKSIKAHSGVSPGSSGQVSAIFQQTSPPAMDAVSTSAQTAVWNRYISGRSHAAGNSQILSKVSSHPEIASIKRGISIRSPWPRSKAQA